MKQSCLGVCPCLQDPLASVETGTVGSGWQETVEVPWQVLCWDEPLVPSGGSQTQGTLCRSPQPRSRGGTPTTLSAHWAEGSGPVGGSFSKDLQCWRNAHRPSTHRPGEAGRSQPLLTDLRTVSQHDCAGPRARPKDMPSPPEDEGEAVWVWSFLGSWGGGEGGVMGSDSVGPGSLEPPISCCRSPKCRHRDPECPPGPQLSRRSLLPAWGHCPSSAPPLGPMVEGPESSKMPSSG